MKTTFTVFLLLGFMSYLNAQSSLSKRALKQAKESVTTLKKAQASHLPSSVITDWWNINNTSWENPTTETLTYNGEGLLWIVASTFNRTTYTYYVDGKKKDELEQYWSGGLWINSSKSAWMYDSEGYESESTYYNWDGVAWVLSSGSRTETTYDGYGDALSEIYSSYNSGTMTWEESYGYKIEYTYTNDLITEQIEYDRQGGAWVIEMKIMWAYDMNDILEGGWLYEHDGMNYNLAGRYVDVDWALWDPVGHVETSLVQNYTQQSYGGPAYPNEEPDNDAHYTNVEKADATYPSGMGGGTPPITIETYQAWDMGAWVDDSRWTWEQMADYESYEDEEWSGGAWIKTDYNKNYKTAILEYNEEHTFDGSGTLIQVSKYSKTYDSFGNKTEDIYETHNGDDNWTQPWGQKWIITYDGGTDHILIRIAQDWDTNSDMYINSMRERFDYSATNVEALNARGIKIFPTAFRNNLAVQSALEGRAYLYNLSGALVKEQMISVGDNRIEGADLEKGYYLIKVSTKEGDTIQKVIKQ